MGHVIKRLTCTTIFWYDISFQSLWRFHCTGRTWCCLPGLNAQISLSTGLGSKTSPKSPEKNRVILAVTNSRKLNHHLQKGQVRSRLDCPIYCLQLWDASFFSSANRLPRLSKHFKPATRRFTISQGFRSPRAGSNMRPRVTFWREGKGGLPGCLVTFSAAS